MRLKFGDCIIFDDGSFRSVFYLTKHYEIFLCENIHKYTTHLNNKKIGYNTFDLAITDIDINSSRFKNEWITISQYDPFAKQNYINIE